MDQWTNGPSSLKISPAPTDERVDLMKQYVSLTDEIAQTQHKIDELRKQDALAREERERVRAQIANVIGVGEKTEAAR